MFSCEFCKTSKTPFLTEHLRWLLLTCFDYSTGTLSAEHIFSEHLFLDGCFTVNYLFFFFVMNWIVSLSIFLISLAAVCRGSAIKLFLRITQISLENNCAGVFFHRFEGLESPAATFMKKQSPPQVFFCKFFKMFL